MKAEKEILNRIVEKIREREVRLTVVKGSGKDGSQVFGDESGIIKLFVLINGIIQIWPEMKAQVERVFRMDWDGFTDHLFDSLKERLKGEDGEHVRGDVLRNMQAEEHGLAED